MALLRLKDEIAFNEAVSPACVRWPSYHYDTVFSTVSLNVFQVLLLTKNDEIPLIWIFKFHQSEQGNIIDKAKTSTFFGTFQPEQIHSITCFKNLTTDIHQFVSIDELCPQGQMNQAGKDSMIICYDIFLLMVNINRVYLTIKILTIWDRITKNKNNFRGKCMRSNLGFCNSFQLFFFSFS